ncbi:hypothetical protein [Sporosarcina limicola]
MSQEDLAFAYDVDRSYISMIEIEIEIEKK